MKSTTRTAAQLKDGKAFFDILAKNGHDVEALLSKTKSPEKSIELVKEQEEMLKSDYADWTAGKDSEGSTRFEGNLQSWIEQDRPGQDENDVKELASQAVLEAEMADAGGGGLGSAEEDLGGEDEDDDDEDEASL